MSKNIPTDQKLYNSIKEHIYAKIPQHSAYRSGLVVKKYKTEFAKKYPSSYSPYQGKENYSKGLHRWFAEEWRNQRGEVGYKYPSDVYRPTKRVTSKTPITFTELTDKRIRSARREKLKKGRVKKF